MCILLGIFSSVSLIKFPSEHFKINANLSYQNVLKIWPKMRLEVLTKDVLKKKVYWSHSG